VSLDVTQSVQAGDRRRAGHVAWPAVLAIVFCAFHLPYRPASLEDLDSINFALGVREFNVAQHQPHPPGYPVYVFVAKAANLLAGSEVAALSTVSIAAGTLGVLAVGALFWRLDSGGSPAWWIAATVLATASPLYWFSAARPLSDTMGLAAALAIQALTLSASTDRAFLAAAFCAGLAAGIRSQVVWLTVPLLVFRIIHHGGRRARGGQILEGPDVVSSLPAPRGVNSRQDSAAASAPPTVVERLQDSSSASSASSGVKKVLAAYACGLLVWAVPMIGLSGGPAGYVRTLTNQGSEDFSGVRMLLTSPTPRELVKAFYYSFVAPWATWWIAAPVLVLSCFGVVVLSRLHQRAAVMLAVAFGPYLLFHMIFQETVTGRYALPLVIPIAYCATTGARALPRRLGLVALAVIAVVSAHVGGTSVAAYSRDKPPAFRLLDDMRAAFTALNAAPVLALDRRQEFDLRRPIRWVGDAMPLIDRKLPAPPQHEWLELVKYWNGGGRAPVWLVVDPMRHVVDLIGRGAAATEPARYRWHVPYPILLSGVRPNEMDWYRIRRPEWYVGEGWELTPEAAGVSAVDRHGLSNGPIEAWIAGETLSGTLVVGGRNFDPATTPRLQVFVNDRLRDEAVVAPGFFLRFLPFGPASDPSADFAKVTIRATPAARVGIEQFDVSSTRALFGYGRGWHEPEFNPQNGLRWRWLSERGELRVRAPPGVSALMLHLEGESPRKYFSRGSRLVVRAREQVVFDRVLSADFSIDAVVPVVPGWDHETTISLETDQVFIPAEQSWRPTGDRRHLGLRVFKCQTRVGSVRD
jgi:hypothetical protein